MRYKFRAWDTVQDQMLPVEAINFRADLISLNEGDNSVTDSSEMFILMQYTGLTDRNGKEIYEGDFVRIEPYFEDSHVAEIEQIDGLPFCIMTPWTEEYDVMPLAWYINRFGSHTVEIVGNRFGNPELKGE